MNIFNINITFDQQLILYLFDAVYIPCKNGNMFFNILKELKVFLIPIKNKNTAATDFICFSESYVPPNIKKQVAVIF